jgi:hypothetical protein
VEVHINDGRAFMTETRRKYDLIVFALTDSLVKVSSLSQLRLENYLFTRESAERAYALLNEHGNVVFYNAYRLLFVAQKIYNMVELVTGTPPKILVQQKDFVTASLLTFLPIYFANLIFSSIFKDQKFAEHIFGWNLLGATFGGVLEYSGMAFGYNALSLIVLGCYTLVFLLLFLAKRRMSPGRERS